MLSAARSGAGLKGPEDGDGTHHPGANVDDGHRQFHRPAIGFAGDRHQPDLSLKNEVVARLSGLGTARPVSRD